PTTLRCGLAIAVRLALGTPKTKHTPTEFKFSTRPICHKKRLTHTLPDTVILPTTTPTLGRAFYIFSLIHSLIKKNKPTIHPPHFCILYSV
ncbi:hypothetical protein, partial [Enterobacter hormaechei]